MPCSRAMFCAAVASAWEVVNVGSACTIPYRWRIRFISSRTAPSVAATDGAAVAVRVRVGATSGRNWTSTTPGSNAPGPVTPPDGTNRGRSPGASVVPSSADPPGRGMAPAGGIPAADAPGVIGVGISVPPEGSPMVGTGISPVAGGSAGVPAEGGRGIPPSSSSWPSAPDWEGMDIADLLEGSVRRRRAIASRRRRTGPSRPSAAGAACPRSFGPRGR